MRLAEIIYLKSDSDTWEVLEKPRPETIKFLSSLVDTDAFGKVVSFYRDYKGLPKNGLSNLLTKSKEEVFEEYRKVVDEIAYLVGLFNIPTSTPINFSYYLLFLYNAFIDFSDWDVEPIKFGRRMKYLDPNFDDNELSIPDENMGIIISGKITKTQLHTWIDDNWETIDRFQSDRVNRSIASKDNIQEIILTSKMHHLQKSGKTMSQIAEMFSDMEKYEGHPINGFEWVKNKIARYRKRLEKYEKTFRVKDDFVDRFHKYMESITDSAG